MTTVIQMDEYRAKMLARAARADGVLRGGSEPPKVLEAEIWGRDYTSLEGVLGGLMKVKDILDCYQPFNEEWKHYLLECIQTAFGLFGLDDRGGETQAMTLAMSQTVMLLKDEITIGTDVTNRREMMAAMLILDNIDAACPRLARM